MSKAHKLETLKRDLMHQLKFETESFDWDHFTSTATKAQSIANSIKKSTEPEPSELFFG